MSPEEIAAFIEASIDKDLCRNVWTGTEWKSMEALVRERIAGELRAAKIRRGGADAYSINEMLEYCAAYVQVPRLTPNPIPQQ